MNIGSEELVVAANPRAGKHLAHQVDARLVQQRCGRGQSHHVQHELVGRHHVSLVVIVVGAAMAAAVPRVAVSFGVVGENIDKLDEVLVVVAGPASESVAVERTPYQQLGLFECATADLGGDVQVHVEVHRLLALSHHGCAVLRIVAVASGIALPAISY